MAPPLKNHSYTRVLLYTWKSMRFLLFNNMVIIELGIEVIFPHNYFSHYHCLYGEIASALFFLFCKNLWRDLFNERPGGLWSWECRGFGAWLDLAVLLLSSFSRLASHIIALAYIRWKSRVS